MKFLCFSDLHRDAAAAEKLVTASQQVDVVIGAGDFATRRQGLEDTLDVLSRIEKPAVLVPGNGESVDELAPRFAALETCARPTWQRLPNRWGRLLGRRRRYSGHALR